MSEKYKYGEKCFPNGYNPIVVLFCYRPISKKIASLLKNVKFVSPNKITILGLMIFILSTYLISFFVDKYKTIGIFLGPLWVFCDYLDGSLARLREESSLLGKKLDALQDHFAFFIIPISIFISLSNSTNINYYFFILAAILFNQYLYAVGIREIYVDGQLPFFQGRPYHKINRFQKYLLHKTKINIGYYSIIQGDTLFLIYWLTSFFELAYISLLHFLLWSIIRNFILFRSYLIKIK